MCIFDSSTTQPFHSDNEEYTNSDCISCNRPILKCHSKKILKQVLSRGFLIAI